MEHGVKRDEMSSEKGLSNRQLAEDRGQETIFLLAVS